MVVFSDIHEALAATLYGIGGWQVSPYILANPTPPTIFVYPGSPDDATVYDLTQRDSLDVYSFTIQAFVSHNSDIGAQRKLSELLGRSGPHSVKALVEADTSLGGLVDDLRVMRVSGFRLVAPAASAVMVAAEWFVDVYVNDGN